MLVHLIWIWPLVVAAACAGSMVWLSRQPVYEPGMPLPRMTPVSFVVGWIMRPGVRLARGARFQSGAMSWLVWTLAGWAVLAVVGISRTEFTGRALILGGLCGLGIGIAAFVTGLLVAIGIAKATNMSNFEGKAGFFAVGIGLMCGLVGFFAGTIGMIYYFSQP